jgi:hypothetical protein
MSKPRVLPSFFLLATVIVFSAAQGRAASSAWDDLSRPAQAAISRAVAGDPAGESGGIVPQTIGTILPKATLGGNSRESLGLSIAISGDTVVAGARFAFPPAVYVFVKPASGWGDTTTFAAKLTGWDDGFGTSVAILGDTVVVGAPQTYDGLKGAAYIFLKPAAGWESTSAFTAKLTESGGQNGDEFGAGLAISEKTIFVGAPHSRVLRGLPGSGAIYVFEEPASGWATTSTFAARLAANDVRPGYELGAALAVSEATLIAGVPRVSAAYVFLKPTSGWVSTSVFDAKISSPDPASESGFGESVAISDDTIVVGVPFARIEPNANQGSAFVFEKPASGWASTSAFQAMLTASDGAERNYFGASVALSGPTVSVGAPAQIDLNLPGAVYVFVKPSGGWKSTSGFDEKLTASDAAGFDAFGFPLASSDGTLAVGAWAADFFGGAVYLFEGFPLACTPGSRCVTPIAPTPTELLGPRQ